MKKLLLKVGLPLVVSLFATQVTFAAHTSFVYGDKKNSDENLHVTTIRLTNPDMMIEAVGNLYYGVKTKLGCVPLKWLGSVRGMFADGNQIGAPAEIFYGVLLSKYSCAVEKFHASGQVAQIEYMLINDGKTISKADPSEQDITLKS